jgi:hypothetical protein
MLKAVRFMARRDLDEEKMMTEEHEEIELEQVWVGAEELPVHFANAFAITYGPNAFFLNIGSQFPPELETEEDFERLKARGYIPIKPIARVALAPDELDELIGALETIRGDYRKLKEQES